MSVPEAKLVPLRIRLPYGSEDEFIERYGSNVARGGIFIATKALKPEGTLLSFELILASGERLMRGEGSVLKTQVDEGGGRSGMTVRFLKLDARSKALVDKVLAHRLGLQAHPPDPAVAPATSAPAPQPAPVPAVPGPAQTAPLEEPRPRRRSLPEVPAASPAPSGSEPILGIDLGTTNSRVALYRNGEAKLLPLDSQAKLFAIPSIVALDEKARVLVGARAKAQVLTDPANTVYGAKRLLGRRARSRKIRELATRFPYAVVPDAEGDAGVELRGKTYALPEICAMLLRHLKEAAQEAAGAPVKRAVLCVPAYFNDHQRAAMLQAGRLAGLEVVRILNEPSAVALAFGYGQGLARKRVLVYDLGGGTFDASVVQITGDDLEVLSTGGDNFLGGIDFDVRVAGELSRELEATEQGKVDESPIAAQRIRDAAESAKIALSDTASTPVHVPFAATRGDGTPVDLRTELSRDTLERLTADLVDRTIEVTQAVLEAGALTPAHLDELILVGGQSRAPLVRRRVEEALGMPVRTDVDAHAAVALGAAILGHALVQKEQGKAGVVLSEVLSAPIGIGVRGGAMRRVLERNTRLPAEKTISLPAQGGGALAITVFQGTSLEAEENEYLGTLSASVERPGEVNVRFAVNPDGTLEVSAQGPDGKRCEAAMATVDASDQVRAALLADAPLPGAPDAPQGGLLRGIKRLFGRR